MDSFLCHVSAEKKKKCFEHLMAKSSILGAFQLFIGRSVLTGH